MKVVFFDARAYEKQVFLKAFEASDHELIFLDPHLNAQTAVLAKGAQVLCGFVNDVFDATTLEALRREGVLLIALRSAGYNNVDLDAAKRLGMTIVRVPEYSPHAVAEFAVSLLLCLNRKIHKAYNRVRELNFSLDGLVGFDLFGKTIGIVGTGRIGLVAAQIFKGFGCKVLAFDKKPNTLEAQRIGFEYVAYEDLLKRSDVISLHLPLTPETKHLVNARAFDLMKPGVVLINTGRGGLIDTKSLIGCLKSKKLGGVGLDVYEVEEGVFFKDLSASGVDDDLLARLITFPNVIVCSHQAFLTNEALKNIADQTLANINAFEAGKPINQV